MPIAAIPCRHHPRLRAIGSPGYCATLLWIIGLIALAMPAHAATNNPDPDHITVSDGGELIEVEPRNEPQDYGNLQWALDHAVPGGTVQLHGGTFFLGDNVRSPRRTLLMQRGLTLRGEKRDGEWLTTIEGGGAVMEPGIGGPIESGPIRVDITDGFHPAVFEQLWFRKWACEVIFNVAGPGLVFRNSRISEPVNRTTDGVKFVHALWSSGVNTRGDFVVENNLVELGGYEDQPADDEQLLGAFFSNHDTIRVVNNRITGMDEAVEIIGNRNPNDGEGATGPAEIVVRDNHIELTANPGRVWPSSYAMLVAGNLNTAATTIKNNVIVTRGKGWAFGLSGSNFTVSDNEVRFEKHDGAFPPGLMSIGFGGGQFDMGASLDDSVIKNNTFRGTVDGPGVVFRSGTDTSPNFSRGNRFEFGDALLKLGATPALIISEGVEDNIFIGQFDEIESKAPDQANRFRTTQ